MTGIELPNLETFSYVAEAGSFTAAAESLGISQAAVSQRISLLEKDLGTALFDRRAGRIQLTDAGQRLYEYAQKILQLHEKARSELVGFSPDAGGELALAASSVPGEHLLPAVLAEFRQKFPDVHVRATVTDSDSVFKDLEHGEAVLGLVGRKSDDSHLEYRPLATDHLVLIISPEHDMGRHGSICLEQLQQLPLVLREFWGGIWLGVQTTVARLANSFARIRGFTESLSWPFSLPNTRSRQHWPRLREIHNGQTTEGE